MTPLSPSSSFRGRHKESADEFARNADTKWLRDGCDYALSELAFQGASKEELSGATRFLEILFEQHTEPAAPKRLPDRSHLPSYEEPKNTKTA